MKRYSCLCQDHLVAGLQRSPEVDTAVTSGYRASTDQGRAKQILKHASRGRKPVGRGKRAARGGVRELARVRTALGAALKHDKNVEGGARVELLAQGDKPGSAAARSCDRRRARALVDAAPDYASPLRMRGHSCTKPAWGGVEPMDKKARTPALVHV